MPKTFPAFLTAMLLLFGYLMYLIINLNISNNETKAVVVVLVIAISVETYVYLNNPAKRKEIS